MQFVGLEAFITVCMDRFHVLLTRRKTFIAAYCAVSYLIGLMLITEVC